MSRFHGRGVTISVLAASVMSYSCGDLTGPDLTGSVYALETVNGKALPHRMWEADGSVQELLADTLTFDGSDRVTQRSTVRQASGAGEIVEDHVTRAVYDINRAGRLTIFHECDPLRSLCTVPDGRAQESGDIRGDTLVLMRDWFDSSEDRLWIRTRHP